MANFDYDVVIIGSGFGGSGLFGEGVVRPEAQSRIRTGFERGLQTRDAEIDLTRVLG
jgi:hypothetical protein